MPAQPNQETILDQNQDRRPGLAQEATNLDRRYGRIGIEAVAAALQYWTAPKKPAQAQKGARIEDRFIELAA